MMMMKEEEEEEEEEEGEEEYDDMAMMMMLLNAMKRKCSLALTIAMNILKDLKKLAIPQA